MAGYAFARMDYKGKSKLFTIILVSMMIPFQVVMIPLFIEIFKLNMLDTYAGLILPRILYSRRSNNRNEKIIIINIAIKKDCI